MLIPLWNLHTGHQCLGENPTRLYRRHRGVESVPVAFFVRRRRAGRVSLKGMFFSLSWWITFSTGSRRSASRSFPTQKLKCFYHHIQAHMRLVIASDVLTWRKFSLNEDVLPQLQRVQDHHRLLMDHHSLVQERYHAALSWVPDREHAMQAFHQALQDHHRMVQAHRLLVQEHSQLMTKTPS